MLEDEYIKLKELKKKNDIGAVLGLILLLLGIAWPLFIALIAPSTWNYIKDDDYSFFYPIVMLI